MTIIPEGFLKPVIIQHQGFTIVSHEGRKPRCTVFPAGADYSNHANADHRACSIEDAVRWVENLVRREAIWNTTDHDYRSRSVGGARMILVYDHKDGATVLVALDDLSEDDMRAIETYRGLVRHG